MGESNTKLENHPNPTQEGAAPVETFMLPQSVSVAKLSTGDAESCAVLWTSLKDHSFAILDVDETLIGDVMNFADVVDQFFKLSREEKHKYEEPDNVEIAKKDNRGYFFQVNREYIKMRMSDPPEKFPSYPANFKKIWESTWLIMFNACWNAFNTIAHFDNNGKQFIRDEDIKVIAEFAREMSSLSTNHYFKTSDLPEFREASSPHTDTGLVTAIVSGTVPGLVIKDRKSGNWLNIEALAKPKQLLLMMGEKIPLFSGSEIFQPTKHKVVIPSNIERTSYIFLLDVGK